MPSDEMSSLRRLVGRLPTYVGTALAASYGTQTGDAVTGAVIGQVLIDVGNDFVERVLSPRQEERVEVVLRVSVERLEALMNEGHQLRDDGFLEPGADGEAVFEGLLLKARDEYEERKLPYMGNMFARIAVDPSIDANTANRALKEAEQLSWQEMCVLSLIGREDTTVPPSLDTLHLKPTTWSSWSVSNSIERLRDRYIYAREVPAEKTEGWGIPLPPGMDYSFASLWLSNLGELLVDLMGLRSIPAAELRDLETELSTLAVNAGESDGARKE